MSRPTNFKVGQAAYWTLATYDADGILVDADSTPTVAVRKNGFITGDIVSVIKRSSSTGLYDCSYNPASESEGDIFTIEESVTVSAQAYFNAWGIEALAAERGTDGANTVTPNTVVPDNASVAAILLDTADLQANQNNWLTATTTISSNMRGTDGANTVIPNTIAPDNASILSISADTADLHANQGQWHTADVSGLASQASVNSLNTNVNTLVANQGDWATANVSGLLTTSGYNASLPANFSTLIVGTGADAGKVTTSNPASGGGSAHTAQDVANLILAVPTTPLGNTASGSLSLVDTTTNLTNGGSGGDDAATIYSYFTNGSNEDVFKANVNGMAQESSVNAVGTAVAAVNSLVQLTPTSTYSFFTSGSNEDVFKADVSALATSASLQSVATVVIDTNADVNALNDITATDIWNYTDINGILPKSAQLYANYLFNINIETVTDKIDKMLVLNGEGTKFQYTVDALENGPAGGGGGSCPTAQEIVDTWGNQSQGSYTTSGTLGFYLDAQVSSAGGGGIGLYQATVRVQDSSSNALQGARVNIDGTTLTATTGTSGEVTFNLDSGVYLLEVSPPAGYDTPTGQVLTVSTNDPANTVFTLTSTLPPTGCDIPWIG